MEVGNFRLDFNHDVSNRAHETFFFFQSLVTAGFFAFGVFKRGKITEGGGRETRGIERREKRYRKEKNGSTYTPVSSIPRV